MYYLQLILNGIAAGCVYALFAIGLTMVYSILRFINFAHGELIAWGAYGVLLFISPPFNLSLGAAVIPATLLVVILAQAQNRFVFGPLRNSQPVTLLIASIGLSFLLRGALQLYFGSDLRSYEVGFLGGLEVGGFFLTYVQVGMIVISVLFLACSSCC